MPHYIQQYEGNSLNPPIFVSECITVSSDGWYPYCLLPSPASLNSDFSSSAVSDRPSTACAAVARGIYLYLPASHRYSTIVFPRLGPSEPHRGAGLQGYRATSAAGLWGMVTSTTDVNIERRAHGISPAKHPLHFIATGNKNNAKDCISDCKGNIFTRRNRTRRDEYDVSGIAHYARSREQVISDPTIPRTPTLLYASFNWYG